MTATSEVRCPTCGKANAGDALFCSGCGRQLGSMLESRLSASISRPIERRVESTANLHIYVQTGSFADQQAAGTAQRLEVVIGVLGQLLELPQPRQPISIFLGEVLQDPAQPGKAMTSGSYAVPDRNEVWSVFRSDAPGIDLERSLVRLLLLAQTGRDPSATPLLLDGVMGLVAQHLGFLPPPPQVNGMLASALAAGAPVAVKPSLNGAAPDTGQVYPLVSAGFVAFLVHDRGAEAFLRYLKELDPQRPDAASKSAYGTSFDGLEKRWLQSLKHSAPQAGGIGRFLRSSWTYLKPYRLKQGEIILYILFSIAFSQALPLGQRYLIQHAIGEGNTTLLFQLLTAGLALFLIMAAASLRQQYLNAQVGEGVMRTLRSRMFTRLQELSADYYSRTATGDILSRMSNDLFAVEFALTGALLQGLVLILTFFATLGSMLYLVGWQLTLLIMIPLPLFFLITRFLGPPASRASRERQERLAGTTISLQENIAAQSVVRSYGLQRTFIREYLDQLNLLYRSAIRLTFLGSLFGLSASLLTTLIQVLVIGIGGFLIIHTTNNITTPQGQVHILAGVATLSSVLQLISGLIAPAQSLSGVAQSLQQASGAMDRVEELLNAKPRIADKPDARAMGPLKRSIAFEHVTFSYTGAEPQLTEVSFTIPAGSAVAFVGPSGSGKSTVTNLIGRFYDAGRGTVKLDGVDVRDLSIESLRGQIGLVMQDNFLFNRSVRENIRFGRESASDAEVEAAAKAAEVHEFILTLPQGYDTITGERGANLSGGQRQRISIARAILRNPSILILDEATSALDPRTENAINHTLASLSKGRTTISVTHRLASAATADRIFVLDRGRLVEQGTHNELLAAGGLYARLYEEQSGGAPAGILKLALEVEYLRRVPFLAGLSADQLSSLASRLTTERFEVGATVVNAGDPGDKLYLIVSGEAAVLAGERELATLRAGDFFGEIALVYDSPRTATVRARSAVTVYVLNRETFMGLLESVPGMRQTVETEVAVRLRRGAPAAEERPASAVQEGANFAVRPQTGASTPVLRDGVSDGAAGLYAAPWTRARARLIVQAGDGAGRAITLNERFTGIGRHPSNDIVLTDRRVSGFHARIERDAAGGFVLIDSGSTNGTRINGTAVTGPQKLRGGAVIQLGATELRFEEGG